MMDEVVQPPKPRGSQDRLAKSKSLHRLLARWSRWLHIYLSMLSLGVIFFFSLTGLTLNHPQWFFRESTQTFTGKMNSAWLNLTGTTPSAGGESDLGHQIEKLEVVEFLRENHRLSGRVSDFLVFPDECEVTFQGPGYAATARIQRDTGEYEVSLSTNDIVSIMNDLHKGRHTGPIWSIVIDVSAVLSMLVAISGFILVFYLRLRRATRVLLAAFGFILMLWLFRFALFG